MHPQVAWTTLVLADLAERAVDDDSFIVPGWQPPRVRPASFVLFAERRTIMTVISLRPVIRLLIVVVLLLVTGPLHACESFVPRAKSADVGRRPPGFTEVYPYTDGIEVEVREVWTGRRLGVAVVELTVVVLNNSADTFEAWISGDLRYGPYRLPAVRYLTPPGPDDRGSVQLLAIGGCSDPYRLSFVLPAGSGDDLVFHLAIDAGAHDPAVFVGSL
jgi:hypothetical protein